MKKVIPSTQRLEKLDVEDEEQRQARMQAFLEKLNSSSVRKTSHEPVFPSIDIGNRGPHAIPPPTELLSRIQAFLPKMEASNAELARRAAEDPKSVDIEHCDEGLEQYIEMNLGLGVLEDKSKRAAHDFQDSDMMSSESESESSDSHEMNGADANRPTTQMRYQRL